MIRSTEIVYKRDGLQQRPFLVHSLREQHLQQILTQQNVYHSLDVFSVLEFQRQTPFIPGSRSAGEIVSVGDSVKDWKEGDEFPSTSLPPTSIGF